MDKTTRILTVDDSASMRALLNHALTSQGFDVSQAEDGEVALEWLALNEVDVVITDINMPRLDGFGVIEQLAFPDQTFDVVLSTLMMHHLPKNLKVQGLAEIVRVLKPGGRLIIADFTRKQARSGLATRFHAGGSNLSELAALITVAGFVQVDTEEMRPPRFSAFPGAGFVTAYKSADAGMIKEG